MAGNNPLPLEVLEFLVENRGRATVSELARGLQVRRNTAYRVVEELERCGWVKTTGRPRQVTPSFRMTHLACGLVRNDRVRNALFPYAVDVATQTGWICHIAFYDDGNAFYSDSMEFVAERLLAYPSGSRVPATCSAPGKILLALQPHEEILRVAARETPRFTARTKTDRTDILEDIRQTRERGYGYAEGETREDIVALAAVVLDETGSPVSALGIGNHLPLPAGEIDTVLPILRRAAERASYELGYRRDLRPRSLVG
jgi:IclR family pca regulon transcriptional regulator